MLHYQLFPLLLEDGMEAYTISVVSYVLISSEEIYVRFKSRHICSAAASNLKQAQT